jgi:hypothetical protein
MSETTSPSTRHKLREARDRLELRRVEAELKLMEYFEPFGWNFGGGGYGNPFDVPPGPDGRQWLPVQSGRQDDRRDGGNRPFFWSDIDLDRARGMARWLATTNPLAIGALESVADYTVRSGYVYKTRPSRRFKKDDTAKELAAMVQDVIDEFQDINSVGESEDQRLTWADREWEAVLRHVRDGEPIVRTFPQTDGTTLARFVEPEQVRQPLGSDPDWSFGVRNEPGDVERVLSYAITYGGPDDWEEVPACDVSHLKANVDSCVKRGLSDFYSTGPALEEVWKLLRAMRVGATSQAAIAWIEQYAKASQATLNNAVNRSRDLNTPRFADAATGRVPYTQKMDAGMVVKIGEGREYLPAPLAQNTTQHTTVVGLCLRSLGARWRMPEYMISGDSSNANYASTLVSGAPFVARVERRQSVYGRFFVRVNWQAVRNAAKAGRFVIRGHAYSYEEVKAMVDIAFTPPQVAIANKLEESQISQAAIASGVMSPKTARARMGLDDEQELENLRLEPVTRVPGTMTDINPQGDPEQPAPATPATEGGRTGHAFFPRRSPRK